MYYEIPLKQQQRQKIENLRIKILFQDSSLKFIYFDPPATLAPLPAIGLENMRRFI